MLKLKELLGDKYTDELASVLEGVKDKLLVNDGSYIPKSRFDQVNQKLKEAQEEAEKVRMSKLSEEEKNAEVLANAEKTIKDYTIKSNRLEVEKVFVGAGIKDYDSYIDSIVTENLEASLGVAKAISKTVLDSLAEKNAQIEKLKLEVTPQPKTGNPNDKVESKLNYTQLAELKSKDPAAYQTYIETQGSQK